MAEFSKLLAVGGHPSALLISYGYFINSVMAGTNPEVAMAATLMGGSFLLLSAARQFVVR
jgi:hypothetical protein